MKLIRKPNGHYDLLIKGELKSIEQFNITKEDCDILTLGYNIKEMGEDATNLRILKRKTPSHIARQYFDGYIEGFNAHKELVKDKLFTVEDMEKAINMATTSKYEHRLEFYSEHEIIQSLLPKTEWDVEL